MPRPPSAGEIAFWGVLIGVVIAGAGWLALWGAGWVPQGTRDRLLLLGAASFVGVLLSLALQYAAHRRAVAEFTSSDLDRDLKRCRLPERDEPADPPSGPTR